MELTSGGGPDGVDIGVGTSVLSFSEPSQSFTTFSAFQSTGTATQSPPSQLSVESNQTQTHFIFLDKVNAVLVEGEGLEISEAAFV